MAQGRKLTPETVDRIYELLDAGLNSNEVSKRLDVTARTVRDYGLVRKLGLNSTGELKNLKAQKRGFKSNYDYTLHRLLQKGIMSQHEYQEELARRNGFDSYGDYENHLAQEKGFGNRSHQRDVEAREEGFRNSHDKTAGRQGLTLTEYLHELAKRRGFEDHHDYQRNLPDKLEQPSVA